eukprot:116337-Pleurochrysis_carterae.AAC.1
MRRLRRSAEGAQRGAETILRLWCSADETRRCVGAMRRLSRSTDGACRCAEAGRRLWCSAEGARRC